ncbi:MAG: hypothetical protein MMC33_007834 [Icmadophila ericetorum]|nr:hypothetical protein [Icmadophila ericetorum]
MDSQIANDIFHSPVPTARHLRTRKQKRLHIRQTIDTNGFNWLVWAVAASGFFTDSYNLFVTNVILPATAFIYWNKEIDTSRETLINCITLAGSIVGQLGFGYLGDRVGRTRLYGIELVVVIFSTIAIGSGSTGYHGTLSFVGWLAAWRFMLGVGIGAEYPLSATITAEWAPTKARTRMMAAVFLMQPVGQLVAQLVGLAVLVGSNRSSNGALANCLSPVSNGNYTCGQIVDGIWRWVTAVGAIPALLAIVFRFMITDPGLYDLDVKNEGDRAIRNTDNLYPRTRNGSPQDIPLHEIPLPNQVDDDLPKQFSRADLYDYFWVQGNIRYLLGTSACWFLADFAFFGLGIGDSRTLAKIWTPPGSTISNNVSSWEIDPSAPNDSIYDVLYKGAKQSVITVSIGSILGSLVFIALGDYIPRRKFLAWSFISLAALFIITGGTFFAVFHSANYTMTIALIAFCYFFFNLGANTITFILPAEIFPTRYRCTCHGISAASGKLGSVFVTAILPSMSFGGVNANSPVSNTVGFIFIIFGLIMAFGAFFAWAWIPDVQGPTENGGLMRPSKTLEELGIGLRRAEEQGQVIGFRRKWGKVGDGLGLRWRRDKSGNVYE